MPRRRKSNPRNRASDGTPNPVDLYVGAMLRDRRKALGMSQEHLACEMDITFQQIQKYERGANRIGASRLFDMARALNVGVGYFFEGLSGDVASIAQTVPDHDDGVSTHEIMALLAAYKQVDPRLRPQIREMVRVMASGVTAQAAE